MKLKSLVLLPILAIALVGCSQQSKTATSSTNSNTGAIATTAPSTAENSTGSSAETPQSGSYTLAEVQKHNNKNDCWLAINGKVYNVTEFIPNHPGGTEILRGCGKDATSLFEGERKHSGPEAQSLLPDYEIGELVQG